MMPFDAYAFDVFLFKYQILRVGETENFVSELISHSNEQIHGKNSFAKVKI